MTFFSRFAPLRQAPPPLARLVDFRPDLILLDGVLPGMDGVALCRQIKQHPGGAGIPVIFVSACTEPEEEARCLAADAVDYVHKPLSPPIPLARIPTTCPSPPRATDEALDFIRQSAGSHFDPALVEVFEKSFDEILAIKNLYRDDTINPREQFILPMQFGESGEAFHWESSFEVGIDTHHEYLFTLLTQISHAIEQDLGACAAKTAAL
ncbi:MAG: response regulator [Sulfuricellaceae bacterium]|jgi:CheY-like chemotaxis protein